MRNTLYIAVISALMSAPLMAGDMKADSDGDEMVSQQEFDTYVADNELFNDLDANGDGYIDQAEFDSAEYDIGDRDGWDFNEWDMDRDTRLSAQEYGRGVFGVFDDNEDGHWDGDEWDDAGDAGFWDV